MDDLAERMDAGFGRADNDIRELRVDIGSLRTEMNAEFKDVRAEMRSGFGDLRAEMHAGFANVRAEFTDVRGESRSLRAELKGDIDALRTTMIRLGIATIVCLLGMIATLIGVTLTGGLAS